MANKTLKTLDNSDSHWKLADSNITADVSDKIIVYKGSDITVTLPTATTHGDKVYVKNISGSSITVDAYGSENIGSGTTFSMTTDTTYIFTVISSELWSVDQYSLSDLYKKYKLDTSMVYVNLKAGDDILIESIKTLK